MNKRIVCLLLFLLLLISWAVPALATEEETQPVEEEVVIRQLTISSAEDFLDFAENCRLDAYSQNLEVTLKADIDLGGRDFSGVPIFCGGFNGNGHTISNLNITHDGSNQGLFRYLTDTAVVHNLHVRGTVMPQGSQAAVGGIAGNNAGKVEKCSFDGDVAGGDAVGGFVGINAVTGIIDGCQIEGSIAGKHFVGGIAGENKGVVRNCVSTAQVNTTMQENAVDISDITMESLTDSETAGTVTDIGGIVGANSGVIRACLNQGNVGYQQMGYNIGGIAGSQNGYIVDCENHGRVHGRKEVGGIVGQMEPATKLEFSEDTLQILEAQLDTLSGLAGRATSNAQGNAAYINSQITNLEDQMETAKDAVDTLIPDKENPGLPDADTILAAQNSLTASMNGMNSSVNAIIKGLEGTISALSRDVQAISNQIGVMGQTLKGADENLGGTLTDVSDLDSEADTTGKVSGCVNYGAVLADLNAGGVTGAMALENELNQEDNLDIFGDTSLNFAAELRSVVLDCENHGDITVKKQNGGGVVGWQSLGLVKGCVNDGNLNGANADYVGGIAGQSSGYIRACNTKSELSGSSYIGGIAGSGAVVSDCRSMTLFHTVTEKMGEVLGDRMEAYTQVEDPIQDNLYLSIGQDWGAIDGISYAGMAEPLSRADFMALEALPEMFKSVKVYFVPEEGSVHTVHVTPGGALDPAQIPQVPEKDGYIGVWDGLAEADLSFVEFDTIFPAVYTKLTDTLQSTALRTSDKPILLAQGQFMTQDPIALTPIEREDVIEAWTFTLPEGAEAHTLRYALPGGYEAEDVRLWVKDRTTGSYQARQFAVSSSYIVFETTAEDAGFCVTQAPADLTLLYWIAGGAVVLIGLIVTATLTKKKKNKLVVEKTTE